MSDPITDPGHGGRTDDPSGGRPACAVEPHRGYEKGALVRDRLIAHATGIFAAKGYAGAATREICHAAGVNIASIHYYFGDKEGLYRAVLTRPIQAFTEQFGRFDDPALPFEQAIRRVLVPFVAMALDDNDYDLQVARLHLREMLEPSAIFREVVAQNVLPQHNALARLLARHCGREAPDADLHQLAFAVIAMANDYCMSREFMKLLAPEVLGRADARERILDRLVGYSVALVNHERARRDPAGPGSSREAGASGSGLPAARTASPRAAKGSGRSRRPEVKR